MEAVSLSVSCVPEPPDVPRNLKVLEATSTAARLSWERPKLLQDDDLPITSFTIQWTPLQSEYDAKQQTLLPINKEASFGSLRQ